MTSKSPLRKSTVHWKENPAHIPNDIFGSNCVRTISECPFIATTARLLLPLWYHCWCMMEVTAPVRLSVATEKLKRMGETTLRNGIGKLVHGVKVEKETKEEAMTGLSHVQPEWFNSQSTRTSTLCLRLYCGQEYSSIPTAAKRDLGAQN